jgi:hypothetical protein
MTPKTERAKRNLAFKALSVTSPTRLDSTAY